MKLDAYLEIANNNHWIAIAPEIGLGLLALFVLALDLYLPKNKKALVGYITIWVQFGLLGLLLLELSTKGGYQFENLFSGLLLQTEITQWMRCFFLLASALVCLLGTAYIKKQNTSGAEFYCSIPVIAAGFMLVVQSAHFVMFFVALETAAIGMYIVIAYGKRGTNSLEAGLKYLISSGFSSSILLFGIVMLYGVAGNPLLEGYTNDAMSFSALAQFIELNSENYLVRMGVVFVLAGVSFKLAAFPFQIWVPDVYQGAPTPITAFLTVSSKASIFMLINLLHGPFFGLKDFLIPCILVPMAIVTILWGNISALGQRNTKRMLGLSGVSHTGYLLVAVIASFYDVFAFKVILFYLFTYLAAAFAVFGVITLVADDQDGSLEIEDFQGLLKNQPFLAFVLAVGLGSLAGIPPLSGFMAKLMLLITALEAELNLLIGVTILGVICSIYYYFSFIREATFRYFEQEGEVSPLASIRVGASFKFALGALATVTILLGLYQGVMTRYLF